MAKPVIYFTGAKFKSGDLVGYRPQLEKATKLKDLVVAEELVLNERLSMSPTELLHAIQVTLGNLPHYVAADGRVREFSNLLCFNRTASGRVDGPGGAWNDTCKAKVSVSVLKDAKATIDATFINSNTTPAPKLDNVTWIGAQTVINTIKVGQSFAAYGRNMQFNTLIGDRAYLVEQDGTEHQLYCMSSDVTNALFNWPAGFMPEPGTTLTFLMQSCGGVQEAGRTTNTKKVIVIAADPQPAITITKVVDTTGEHEDNTITINYGIVTYGANLANATISVKFTDRVSGQEVTETPEIQMYEELYGDIVCPSELWIGLNPDMTKPATIIATSPEGIATKQVTFNPM